MAESRITQTKQERRRRTGQGLDRSRKLYVPEDKKDPNFAYRWFNDTPGRIEQKTVHDDWDVVTTDKNGEPYDASRPVGPGPDGKPIYAKLCRKRKEYYDQDEAEKMKAIKAQEDDMRVAPPPSTKGLSAEPQMTYVPGGRNTITKS